jgi:hypothetical protein
VEVSWCGLLCLWSLYFILWGQGFSARKNRQPLTRKVLGAVGLAALGGAYMWSWVSFLVDR